MKKLAIFDLDGTLFNTDMVNFYSYNEALKEFGYEIDKKYYINYCNGRHYKVFLPQIIKDEEIVEKVHDLKKQLYNKYLDKVKVNIHLFEIIKLIKNEYHIALVTTASKKNTLEILNYYKYKDLFDLIITSEDIKNPKPNPEGFLKAMESFKTSKENTIIFEDSLVGIEAARKTGSTVFVINKF